MRIKKQTRIQGSVLVTTLVTATIMGVALASYLMLVSTQSKSVARSLAWNTAIPVAESGIEEALTQIYYTGTNVSGNNWTLGSDGLYHKQRAVGNDGSYYEVTIQAVDPPVIVSKGYVPAPLAASSFISRTVRVNSRKASSPGGGITARGPVSLSGGAFLDSFDSTDPNYSTNGLYTPDKRKDNGQIIVNAKSSGAISLSGGGGYLWLRNDWTEWNCNPFRQCQSRGYCLDGRRHLGCATGPFRG